MNIILQFSRGSFKRFCLSADLPIAVLFQCVLSNNQTTIYIYNMFAALPQDPPCWRWSQGHAVDSCEIEACDIEKSKSL